MKRIIYGTKREEYEQKESFGRIWLGLLSHARHWSETSLQVNVGTVL